MNNYISQKGIPLAEYRDGSEYQKQINKLFTNTFHAVIWKPLTELCADYEGNTLGEIPFATHKFLYYDRKQEIMLVIA